MLSFVEQALLHFIYKDTLIDDEELYMSPFLPLVSETFAAKLLAAAEKYELPRLKLMCESVLCKDISVDSVSYMLALADRYHATELKSICLKFSAENLVGKLSFLTFHQYNLRFEVHLYFSLYNWACSSAV